MGATDFDFLPGRWKVAQPPAGRRRRRGRTFDATSEAEAMLGGIGNA